MKTVALVAFITVYALLLLLPRGRWIAPVAAAALFVGVGIVPAGAAWEAVDWNVLMMLCGTMGTVDLFIRSKMPERLSDHLVNAIPSVKKLIIVLALFAGLVSAFVDNVATVLMLAPVGIAIAKKLNISPVEPIIAIAVSSNLQGAATLVGDTTSLLLAGHLKMDFLDFFVYQGKPGMFWFVQIGALATVPVMMWLFRKNEGYVAPAQATAVEDYLPTWMMGGTVAALILASFIPGRPAMTNGFICMGIFLVGLLAECFLPKKVREDEKRGWAARAAETLKAIDVGTLALLAGLFIVIDGLNRVGIIADISQALSHVGGGSPFLTYTIVVWASVLFSAFIDNIPYTAAMLPVMAGAAGTMGIDQTVLCFGLLVGATLGGNLTPVGASANITATAILEKEGYLVSPKEFMRIGVPFTLVAVLSGYVLVWVFYGM